MWTHLDPPDAKGRFDPESGQLHRLYFFTTCKNSALCLEQSVFLERIFNLCGGELHVLTCSFFSVFLLCYLFLPVRWSNVFLLPPASLSGLPTLMHTQATRCCLAFFPALPGSLPGSTAVGMPRVPPFAWKSARAGTVIGLCIHINSDAGTIWAFKAPPQCAPTFTTVSPRLWVGPAPPGARRRRLHNTRSPLRPCSRSTSDILL